MAEEPKPAFKVLSDDEAIGAGLLVELSEADKQAKPKVETVVDQGIRSKAPRITPAPEEAERPFIPWEMLPPQTRAELEMGRARLGAGGLSARQIYDRNKPAEKERPKPLLTVIPDVVTIQEQIISARTQAEMDAGRVRLSENNVVRKTVVDRMAELNARRLVDGFKPTGDEMNYFEAEPPA